MRVWKSYPNEGAQFVQPDPPEKWEVLHGLQGKRHANWAAPRVRVHKEGRNRKPVDIFAGTEFIVTTRAKEALEGVFGSDAEFLPLACPDMPLWLVNNLNVIDALDKERSEIIRFPSSGRVMTVRTPVFLADRVGRSACFALPEEPHIMYLTDTLARAVRAAGLTGLALDEPIWSDEPAPSPASAASPAQAAVPDSSWSASPQRVAISAESYRSDDPNDIVDSNKAVVDALFAEYIRADEIPVDALRSYYVDYYLMEFENGGFSQFAYNINWDQRILGLVLDGMRCMGATEHLAILSQNVALVSALGPEGIAAYLDSGYFGENDERDILDRNNERLTELADREDITALNAAWLKSLPDLLVLEADDLQQEVMARAALVPDREKRIADARANEPRYLKLIRALTQATGQELSRVTAADPSHVYMGVRTTATHFLTDQGHYYMVEMDGRALMIDDAGVVVTQIFAPAE